MASACLRACLPLQNPSSSPRKRGSRHAVRVEIPASAGMTTRREARQPRTRSRPSVASRRRPPPASAVSAPSVKRSNTGRSSAAASPERASPASSAARSVAARSSQAGAAWRRAPSSDCRKQASAAAARRPQQQALHPQQLRHVDKVAAGLDPADRRVDQGQAFGRPAGRRETFGQRDLERGGQHLVARAAQRRQAGCSPRHRPRRRRGGPRAPRQGPGPRRDRGRGNGSRRGR